MMNKNSPMEQSEAMPVVGSSDIVRPDGNANDPAPERRHIVDVLVSIFPSFSAWLAEMEGCEVALDVWAKKVQGGRQSHENQIRLWREAGCPRTGFWQELYFHDVRMWESYRWDDGPKRKLSDDLGGRSLGR